MFVNLTTSCSFAAVVWQIGLCYALFCQIITVSHFCNDIDGCHHVKLMSNSGFELESNTVVTQKPGVSLRNESGSRRGQCTKTLGEAVLTKGLIHPLCLETIAKSTANT